MLSGVPQGESVPSRTMTAASFHSNAAAFVQVLRPTSLSEKLSSTLEQSSMAGIIEEMRRKTEVLKQIAKVRAANRLKAIEQEKLAKKAAKPTDICAITGLSAVVNELRSCATRLGMTMRSEERDGATECRLEVQDQFLVIDISVSATGMVTRVSMSVCGSAPDPSVDKGRLLLEKLSAAKFEDFYNHVRGWLETYCVFCLDVKLKPKLMCAMSAIEEDIRRLNQSFTPSNSKELRIPATTAVNSSVCGYFLSISDREKPSLVIYTSPYDVLCDGAAASLDSPVEALKSGTGIRVSVGLCALTSSRKLQISAMVTSVNPLTMTQQLNASNSASVPANFVITFNKPFPMFNTYIEEIHEYTKSLLTATQDGQPYLALLSDYLGIVPDHANTFYHNLPNCGLAMSLDPSHSCEQVGSLSGAKSVEKILFTNILPLPHIIAVIRKQAVVNSLIGSLMKRASVSDARTCNVTVPNPDRIRIKFAHPIKMSCIVSLDVDALKPDFANPSCLLFTNDGTYVCDDSYPTTVLRKCGSLPHLVRCVLKKCEQLTIEPGFSSELVNCTPGGSKIAPPITPTIDVKSAISFDSSNMDLSDNDLTAIPVPKQNLLSELLASGLDSSGSKHNHNESKLFNSSSSSSAPPGRKRSRAKSSQEDPLTPPAKQGNKSKSQIKRTSSMTPTQNLNIPSPSPVSISVMSPQDYQQPVGDSKLREILNSPPISHQTMQNLKASPYLSAAGLDPHHPSNMPMLTAQLKSAQSILPCALSPAQSPSLQSQINQQSPHFLTKPVMYPQYTLPPVVHNPNIHSQVYPTASSPIANVQSQGDVSDRSPGGSHSGPSSSAAPVNGSELKELAIQIAKKLQDPSALTVQQIEMYKNQLAGLQATLLPAAKGSLSMHRKHSNDFTDSSSLSSNQGESLVGKKQVASGLARKRGRPLSSSGKGGSRESSPNGGSVKTVRTDSQGHRHTKGAAKSNIYDAFEISDDLSDGSYAGLKSKPAKLAKKKSVGKLPPALRDDVYSPPAPSSVTTYKSCNKSDTVLIIKKLPAAKPLKDATPDTSKDSSSYSETLPVKFCDSLPVKRPEAALKPPPGVLMPTVSTEKPGSSGKAADKASDTGSSLDATDEDSKGFSLNDSMQKGFEDADETSALVIREEEDSHTSTTSKDITVDKNKKPSPVFEDDDVPLSSLQQNRNIFTAVAGKPSEPASKEVIVIDPPTSSQTFKVPNPPIPPKTSQSPKKKPVSLDGVISKLSQSSASQSSKVSVITQKLQSQKSGSHSSKSLSSEKAFKLKSEKKKLEDRSPKNRPQSPIASSLFPVFSSKLQKFKIPKKSEEGANNSSKKPSDSGSHAQSESMEKFSFTGSNDQVVPNKGLSRQLSAPSVGKSDSTRPLQRQGSSSAAITAHTAAETSSPLVSHTTSAS